MPQPITGAWWSCTVCGALVVKHGEDPNKSACIIQEHAEKCGPTARFVTKRLKEKKRE